MYVPPHFAETRPDVIHQLIRNHPLAILVTRTTTGELDANHLPLELILDGTAFGTLRGHVARANPVWQQSAPEFEVLVIFQGPQKYISPGWYATKKETGKVVPTWNYAVVHAYGYLRIIEDIAWLHQLVNKLTDRHEGSRPEPWKTSDAPHSYIQSQLQGIVGIEIPISRWVGKWKMSQNRPEVDREAVMDALADGDDLDSRSLREWMLKQRPKH
jgi:transcriptional regulator